MSPVWAAVAMLAQNILAVFLVQAEARNRALLAGLLDCLMWPAGCRDLFDRLARSTLDRASGASR